jgi:hypothetical protein
MRSNTYNGKSGAFTLIVYKLMNFVNFTELQRAPTALLGLQAQSEAYNPM